MNGRMMFNDSKTFLPYVVLYIPYSLLYSVAIFMLLPIASLENQTCQVPDVPNRGECFRAFNIMTDGYENNPKRNCDVSGEYSPGDEITYSCEEPLVLIGRENRTCTSYGTWSGTAPICDKPTNIGSALRMRYGPEIITDGDESTCAWWEVKSGSFVIPLPEKLTVRKIQIVYETHSTINGVDVFLTENVKCYITHLQMRPKLIIECRDNNIPAEFIRIRADARSFLKICEVEISNKENEPITITSAPFIAFDKAIVSNWTDGDVTTCDDLDSGINGILFPLKRKAQVRAVRIYAREVGAGDLKFDVFTRLHEKCGTFEIKKRSTQWHLLECQDTQALGEFVRFVQWGGIYLSFCEVQIFLENGDEETIDSEDTMVTEIYALEGTSSTDVEAEKENKTAIIASVSISVLLVGIFSAILLSRHLARKKRARNVSAANRVDAIPLAML